MRKDEPIVLVCPDGVYVIGEIPTIDIKKYEIPFPATLPTDTQLVNKS